MSSLNNSTLHELMKAELQNNPTPITTESSECDLIDFKTYNVDDISFYPPEKRTSSVPFSTNQEYYLVALKSTSSCKPLMFTLDTTNFGIHGKIRITTSKFKKPTQSETHIINQLRLIEQKCKEHILLIKDEIGLPNLTMKFLDDHKLCVLVNEGRNGNVSFISSKVNQYTTMYNPNGDNVPQSKYLSTKSCVYRSKAIIKIIGICISDSTIKINTFLKEAIMYPHEKKSYLF